MPSSRLRIDSTSRVRTATRCIATARARETRQVPHDASDSLGLSPQSSVLSPRASILGLRSSVFGPQPSVLSPQWTADCGPRTVDRGLWTADCGPRTVDRGLWPLDCDRGPLEVGAGGGRAGRVVVAGQ